MRILSNKRTSQLLRVDENFATLLAVHDNGSYTYEFAYFSDTVKVLNLQINTVKITIRKDLPSTVNDVFQAAREKGDLGTYLKDVLTHESRLKDAKRESKQTNLVSVNSDLTANFNNSLSSTTKSLSKNSQGTKRFIELKSVAQIKQQNIDPPMLQTNATSAAKPSRAQAQQAAAGLIARGIDPSIAGTPQSSINGAHSAFSGLTLPNAVKNLSSVGSPIEKGQNILVASLHAPTSQQTSVRQDFDDKTLIPVIVDAPIKQVLNKKNLLVPADVGNNDFYVVFELVDVRGVVHETLTKKVAHSLLSRVFNTPKEPPRVGIAPQQFPGKNVLDIEQLDPRATMVKIMRRRVRATIDDVDAVYELVAEIPLRTRDGLVKFIDIVNNSSTILYRCIPMGLGGLIGTEFTNVVAQPVKFANAGRHNKSIDSAFNVKVIPGGHSITITSLPASVIAAAIVQRNMTVHESGYSHLNISEPIKIVGSSLANMVFLHNELKNDDIYEYGCLLYFDDGVVTQSTTKVLKKYVSPSVGAVDVELTDLQVIQDSIVDVTFNVNSRLSDEGLSAIQKTLKRQNLADLYQDELNNERDRLQKLIAHQISRIDITAGHEESFGTFTGTFFSDAVEGKRMGVSKLRSGRKYRYVISTLVRDPETLFDAFKKDAEDPATGKSYQFKPAFFKHPITLNKGTIVTRESLASNHPEDDFAHGHLGNTHEIDVTIDTLIPKIIDVTPTRVDQKTVLIQWNAEGPIEKFDHFIVMKERLGQSSVIGKMHNVSQGKTFEFFDDTTLDDVGEISYRIVPVTNTFARSSDVTSSVLKIIDARGFGSA